ncbi:MAG: helix-turn-helix transcriptional regulator [Devosia nanyangense]|uniref:Helix-turn-helix transcriptional regulator n=1 Tax=Devosia nanyangense TaxID=1228055 RepID=A0A933NYM5_9HYPH|nr:helix-turn-helix transcriptional regulator [Devosia nanyangense]
MSDISAGPIEVGSIVDTIYDTLLGGGTLQRCVDAIRASIEAVAVVLTIDGRGPSGDRLTVCSSDHDEGGAAAPGHALVDVDALLSNRPSGAKPLADTLADYHQVTADAGASDDARYHLAMFRNRDGSPFDERDSMMCAMLLGHVRRAFELAGRIGTTDIECQVYSSALDKLSVGAIILDDKGAVLQTTALAAAILNARDGLTTHRGHLAATSSCDDKDLQLALKAALASPSAFGEIMTAPRAVSVARDSGARDLGLIVQPLGTPAKSDSKLRRSAAVVFIRDADRNAELESGMLRQLFDLTPAEAAVARSLTTGLSLDEAAGTLNISRNTARAHLRSIFSKSGISRQTELMRLMLNSAAVLGETPARTLA